jgi:hypothetical protein
MTNKLLNPAEAGHVLGVCRDRIIQWDKDGSLVPTRRLGPQGRTQYDLATHSAFSVRMWGADVTAGPPQPTSSPVCRPSPLVWPADKTR